MFGKFKEKLKETLSLFSKKTKEEAAEKAILVTTKEQTEIAKTAVKESKEKKEISPRQSEKKKKKAAEPREKVELQKEQEHKEREEKEDKEVEAVKPEPKLPQESPAEEQLAEKKGFFAKLKETITTKTISSEKFGELFWDMELVLLENNVSVEVIEKIKQALSSELVDKPLPRDVEGKIEETLRTAMYGILNFKKENVVEKIKQNSEKPFVIAFFGVNGAGKTTSIAKVAHLLQKNKLSVVFAACDTFRAAAIQQLEEHAQKLGITVIKHDYGSDAAAVAFDAIKHAEKHKIDVVLIDTAGRLHSNTNLMAELGKIIRVTKPDLNVFVGESITGNDCIEQARKFNELVSLDGVILTKADVDEKGGAPLSIAYTIKKPILYLGVGQRYEDLEEFATDKMLKRLGF